MLDAALTFCRRSIVHGLSHYLLTYLLTYSLAGYLTQRVQYKLATVGPAYQYLHSAAQWSPCTWWTGACRSRGLLAVDTCVLPVLSCCLYCRAVPQIHEFEVCYCNNIVRTLGFTGRYKYERKERNFALTSLSVVKYN